MTSFAVILEIKAIKIHPIHAMVLSYFTYIGCSFSIFGLITVILTFVLFRKWRKDIRHKILFYLSVSLLSLLLIFFVGIKQTDWGYGCLLVSVLLHYFMLSSFCWMLVEAYLQYLCLVKVMGWYISRFLQKAMLFAFGTPAIIIGTILSVNHEHYYGGTAFCWLSGDIFPFAVLLPVSVLLAINFVIFGVIFFSITCKRSKHTMRTNQDQRKEMVDRAKSMFCVSLLLGLSWVFGFFAAVEETNLACQYMFDITATLQGFMFFVCFVLRQKQTRDLWRNWIRKKPPSNSSQPMELEKHQNR